MAPLLLREGPVTPAGLVLHGRIPIAFEVRSRFDPRTGVEVPVTPWVKDYDRALPPIGWARDFDVSRWGHLVAVRAGVPVGGAVIAWRTPEVDLLERCPDRVAVWDIRVAPHERGRGVGRALWDGALRWARARRAVELVVETQDVNADACRFYAAMGCTLLGVFADVYRDFPEELQVVWRQDVRSG